VGNGFPKDVDNRVMVSGSWASKNLSRSKLKGGVDYELNSKERETVIFRTELKVMTSGSERRGVGEGVDIRLIVRDVDNLTFTIIETEAANKPPIIVEGTRVLRNRERKREGRHKMVTRHTLAGEFLQWCKRGERGRSRSGRFHLLCIELGSLLQKRLRVRKSKRGRASSSLYTPALLWLKIDYCTYPHI